MKEKVVKVGDFVRVLDDTLAKFDVKEGDNIYLAGDIIVPDKEGDPYSRRQVFIAAYMNGDHVDADRKPFTIDGKRVRKLGDNIQERLTKIKKEDFDEASD